MIVRNVANIPRGFGGCLIVVALIVIAASMPSQTIGSSDTSLGVRMTRLSTGRAVLTVRGGSVDDGSTPTGEFATTADLIGIPCPGRYRFQAETENQTNGASSSWTATIVLSHFSSRTGGVSCGTTPPPRPGTGAVTVAGEAVPFHLTGSRGGSGNFIGTLKLRGQPECGEPYTLTTDLDLRGWHRSFSYRLEVVKVEVKLQGITYAPLGCGG